MFDTLYIVIRTRSTEKKEVCGEGGRPPPDAERAVYFKSAIGEVGLSDQWRAARPAAPREDGGSSRGSACEQAHAQAARRARLEAARLQEGEARAATAAEPAAGEGRAASEHTRA